MGIIRRELDYAEFQKRTAAEIDRESGLEAWSSGRKTLDNSPSDPFVKSSSAPEPRQIPAGTALTDEDRADLQGGKAVVTFEHNVQLSAADRALIESGQAVQLPRPIPSNATDRLTTQDLQDLSSGRATLTAPTRETPGEYARNPRTGQLEVASDSINKALAEGACLLEDIASGKTRLVS